MSLSPRSRLSHTTRVTRNRWSSAFRAPRSDYLTKLEGSRFVPAYEPDEDWKPARGWKTRPVLGQRKSLLSLGLALCAKNGRFSAKLIVMGKSREARVTGCGSFRRRAVCDLGTNAMTNTASALGLGTGRGASRRSRPNGAGSSLSAWSISSRGSLRLAASSWRLSPGVYVVGIMMLIAGVFRSHPLVPDQELGTLYLLAPAWRPLHHRRVRGVRQSAADRGLADAHSRRGAGRIRPHAGLPWVQYARRIAVDLGRRFGPHHPAA